MIDDILDPLVTESIIADSVLHIENTYPDVVDGYFKDRLIELQSYIQVCMSNQSVIDDIYHVKLGQYSKELDKTLTQSLLPPINDESAGGDSGSGIIGTVGFATGLFND